MEIITETPYSVAIVTMIVLAALILAIIVALAVCKFKNASGLRVKHEAKPIMRYNVTGEKNFKKVIESLRD